MEIELTIENRTKDCVVIRKGGTYEQHSHFKNKDDMNKFLKLLDQNRMPKGKYNITAMKRLLTEEEFSQLTGKRKQRYYNVAAKKAVRNY